MSYGNERLTICSYKIESLENRIKNVMGCSIIRLKDRLLIIIGLRV